MKTSQTIISTLRDAPSDAVIASHQLMMRAGLIRKLSNGLYVYMPLGLRAFRKVENIIREELDAAGCLEIKPTVVQPGDLWKESGRWQTAGEELLRMKSRTDQDLIVSPTAEEAFTAVIRDITTSYKQLPVIPYQINTKYRDEIRPRYGVMRGREFVMMDAYSFDADQKSLDESYEKLSAAYKRIFKRMGLNTIPVRADSGFIGGSGSEEFMVESEVGDDTLMLCGKCGYAANLEKAICKVDEALGVGGAKQVAATQPIEKVPCPGVETIAQMEEFFQMPATQFIKVLIYKVYNCGIDLSDAPGGKTFARGDDGIYPEVFVAVAIRGDLDVNEVKLAAVMKASGAELADEENVLKYSGAPHGFVGPVGLTKLPLLADESVMVEIGDASAGDSSAGGCVASAGGKNYEVRVHDTVTGSGEANVDFRHVEPCRDFTPFMTRDVRTVKVGDLCAECGAPLYSKKGNELGHIFKLGTKYTKAMNMTYLDVNGKAQTPLMGCYGIGLDRTLASIIEEHHDEKGIIWTMSTAPYQVCIVPIKYDGEMKRVADELYDALTKDGIEVLLDDRNERPGVKFNDMDLIGIPVRIVVGEKNLPNVELKLRSATEAENVPATEAAAKVAEIVRAELAKLNG